MTIQLQKPDITELKPRISVFGVGGGGGNAVNNMINAGLQGVEFVVANTDAQALTMSKAERRIQLGVNATDGLGAGSHPEIGREAAEECLDEIMDHLGSSHMVFVTAGMGGGTGTGAAPVIARAAREKGILTVGVVTKPFHFEGQRRMKTAEAGIEELQKNVDTLIVIPNQNLFRIATEQTTFADAFSMADQVLYSGVASITDLMVHEGLVNLDFADVRSVMQKMGKAMMGTGEASDNGRALAAAEAAIANPLLDETSMRGARGLLISITGGRDMTLFEVDEAANRIREEVDPDANVIFGAIIDEALEGIIRVSVVATGIDARSADAVGSNDFVGSAALSAGQAAASLLKKDSPAVAAAAVAPANIGYDEEEDFDADKEAAEDSYAEAGVSDNRAAGRFPGNGGRANTGSQSRMNIQASFNGNRSGLVTAREAEAMPAELPPEIATDNAAPAEENAAVSARAAQTMRVSAEMTMNAPAPNALHGGGGLGQPVSRHTMPAAGQPSLAGQREADPFSLKDREDFSAELRQNFSPRDREERAESVNGARGFIKKLQSFFGGGDDNAARLEPAEEETDNQANGRRNGRAGRPDAAFTEMTVRAPGRPANMARPAAMQRPDTMLYGNQRVQARMALQEDKEEEKLEIPAFLRRQSH
ncbi:cell division protein FtsZ [Candidatus Tokpelaia sp.]|nr:cell division protein FtsZ [Candidatus Tokpelaia sp.]KAA6405870.1 cell division protein FtsZ [Candidatus Tokpelaia sp.]